jgi:hypothetical protein
MSFGSYSSTPASNVSCNGINIAEGCPAANVNNCLRQLMADGKSLYDTVAGINVSSYMPISGGGFTGTIWAQGLGSYTYWAASSLISGAQYVQPVASSLPSPAEGTIVFQY